MKFLKPRQIIMVVIILLLGAWNVWRYQQQRHVASSSVLVTRLTPVDSEVWTAFEKAASLRDAPEEQFAPAFAAVQAAESAVQNPNLLSNANILSNVRGCMTWLEFYRGHKDAAWHTRSQQHLDACVHDHRDESN
ncbi:MAG: hypothetical protein PW735_04180 [Acidobacteriaceae bacterium]|nr:hypothetical protein [Acidobacteriaceae bacterium]